MRAITHLSHTASTPERSFATVVVVDAAIWLTHAFAFGLFVLLDRKIDYLYLTLYLAVKLWLSNEVFVAYYVARDYLSPYAKHAMWFYINMQYIRHWFAIVTVVLSLLWHWKVRQVVVVYCIMSLIEVVALVPALYELQKAHKQRERAKHALRHKAHRASA